MKGTNDEEEEGFMGSSSSSSKMIDTSETSCAAAVTNANEKVDAVKKVAEYSHCCRATFFS